MIKKIAPALLFISLIISCSHKKDRPTTALDTGREFIRETLDGDYEEAQSLLYKDTFNVQFFDSYKLVYERLPENDKKNYKSADYIINKYTDLNDSTTIINYSNTYKKEPLAIMVIRKNGEWLVDFKYTISGNLTN